MTNVARKLKDPRTEVPGVARHEGVWEGVYRHYDAEGRQVDEHRSVLECRFPESGPYPYHQTNHYRWADGRTQTREFPAQIDNGKLVWSGGLIDGWCAEIAQDERGRTLMLHWTRQNEPGVYLYEMIQLSDCGQYRSRVWQWFRNGRLSGRTLIDEARVEE